MKQNIGVIGLSVMGSNLALNIADNGFKVAVFNRTTSVVDKILKAINIPSPIFFLHYLKILQ